MNDKRLIDANVLVDKVKLDWGLTHQSQLISATTKLAVADAMCKLLGEVAKSPTIDAVEVVRCRECIHHVRTKSNLGFSWCGKFGNVMRDSDFCSWGERKMDGGAEGV